MTKPVKVACHVPNGIMLRLLKPGFDDGSGAKPAMVNDGPAVRLNGPSSKHTGAGNTTRADLPPGETEVDRDWMARWMKQHAHSPLVSMKQVVVLDEEAEYLNPTR